MKAIFAIRKNCFESPGGDTIQMLKTKEHLEKNFGLTVEICLSPKKIRDYDDIDIVHLFNIQTVQESLEYMLTASACNKKIVLTPIYWDMSHSNYIEYISKKLSFHEVKPNYYHFKDAALQARKIINTLLRKTYGLYNTKKYIQPRRYLLNHSDLILPNSNEEARILSDFFRIDYHLFMNKTMIVPNAVDSMINGSSADDFSVPVSDFVLEVARIEPTKNQIGVISALMDMPNIPILFIGKKGMNNAYYEQVKSLAQKRGNVIFIDEVPHETISNFYKKAKVHVLPSFRESPGLSSLEALCSGCNIVVSTEEYCPVKYYQFDKLGHLCNPYDYTSIHNAIMEAYHKPRPVLSEQYIHEFSYNFVAEKTYQAYQRLNS